MSKNLQYMVDEDVKKLINDLESVSKDEITKKIFPVIEQYISRFSFLQNKDFYIEWIKSKKNPTKPKLIEIVINFFNDREVYQDYLSLLSPQSRLIIEKAIDDEAIHQNELDEIYQQAVVVNNNKGNYILPELRKEWGHLLISRYFYYGVPLNFGNNVSFSLYFPKALRRLFALQHPKFSDSVLKPLDFEPKSTIINYEESIFAELPLVMSYIMQGDLKYTAKGYLIYSSVKKMSKALAIKEFECDKIYHSRSSMLAGMFNNININSLSLKPQTEIIKILFSHFLTVYDMANFMLPHLKGLNYMDAYDYTGNLVKEIFQIFKSLPVNKWYAYKEFSNIINRSFIEIVPIKEYFFSRIRTDEYRQSGATIMAYDSEVYFGNKRRAVEQPYLASYVFLMAAWGLMEIATNDYYYEYSPYQRLEAFKLTDLGAYVLGISQSYTAKATDVKNKIIFDDNSLQIRVEGNTRLAETVLQKFAIKVTENRYQFSAALFLKDCISTRMIQNKVDLFNQIINQQLPIFWQNYLKQLVENSKAVTLLKNTIALTLPAENKELIRLVINDEELKPIIIKAENFIILIKEKDYSKVQNRLKTFGYLLPEK